MSASIPLPHVYVNSGKRDKTLNGYFNMPEKVMRNGKWVVIADNNASVLKKRKHA